jgi:hypothetical protein
MGDRRPNAYQAFVAPFSGVVMAMYVSARSPRPQPDAPS